MISAQKQLIEKADAVQERIAQVQREGMEFHEELPRLGEKEGLKGRKHSKALESFTWNITVLKVLMEAQYTLGKCLGHIYAAVYYINTHPLSCSLLLSLPSLSPSLSLLPSLL
ncbi:unnamed protein product, partial [Oncorhynchus mykiss]